MQDALQQGTKLVPHGGPPRATIAPKQKLGLLPNIVVQKRGMLAWMHLGLVFQFADVGDVGQQLVETRFGELLATALVPLTRRPALVRPTADIELAYRGDQRLVFEVEIKNGSDLAGFFLVDGQLGVAWIDVLAQQGHAAGPFSLAACGGDFIASPFGNDFSFKLGKRQQHIQHESSHRAGSVELLSHRDERDLVPLKCLHHVGEIEQAATEPVDLINDNAVDGASFDVGEQSLERRPLHVPAGEAPIVITIGQTLPAFMMLAFDVGFSRFALSVKRIELLLQPFLR